MRPQKKRVPLGEYLFCGQRPRSESSFVAKKRAASASARGLGCHLARYLAGLSQFHDVARFDTSAATCFRAQSKGN